MRETATALRRCQAEIIRRDQMARSDIDIQDAHMAMGGQLGPAARAHRKECFRRLGELRIEFEAFERALKILEVN